LTGLTFEAVACTREGRQLFEGLSFALAPGDALLIEGPNGAGKSSLLRLAAGLLDRSAGTVVRDGRLALADERPALDEHRTLRASLDYWARLDGGDANRALGAVGLMHLTDVPVRMLSTGQRRRAGLARVVAACADIWLLDEPISGLDEAAVTGLEALIAAHRTNGGIVLVASHQSLALPESQRVRLG